jgi:hypothetical protein
VERLADDVKRALGAVGGGQAGMATLVARWPAIVGEQMARNAWPARVARDGTLHVATSSAAWAFELTQMRSLVLGRLRAALGDDAPGRLAFAPGKVPEPAGRGSDPPAPTRRLPGDAERAQAREVTASIADPELRERVASALAAALAGGR